MQSSYRRLAVVLATLLLSTLPAPYQTRGAPASPAPGADKSVPQGYGQPPSMLSIPGPLNPLLRLAAVSRLVPPEDVLPLLSHQIVLDGYGGRASNPTEYLLLVKRYVEQARELQTLAGPDGSIRITNCNDAPRLLNIIGYRLEQPCGPLTTLQTGDSKRAFTAIDSGFPLAELEKSLAAGKPFVYPFHDTQLPVIFEPAVWLKSDRNKNHKDLLDALLGDPELARLYWGLAQIDEETRAALRVSPGLDRLLPLAPVLDFYGEQIRIRSGRVLVPGGPQAESAWERLVGVSPRSPGEFVIALLSKDDGWMAPYYDSLARVSGPQQDYFTESHRLGKFYQALRGHELVPGPARSVFRSDPGLLLLASRMPLDPDSQPHVPGNLEVWADILRSDASTKLARELVENASHISTIPKQLIEALFALSRAYTPKGPLQAYLALSEIDRARGVGKPLSPQTAPCWPGNLRKYNDQYPGFCRIPCPERRHNNRICKPHEAIEPSRSHRARRGNRDFSSPERPVANPRAPGADSRSGSQCFLATASPPLCRHPHLTGALRCRPHLPYRTHRAATGKPQVSQDEIIELVAGPEPTSPHRAQIREEIANRMRSVLEAQRLVSLDTLLALGDGLPLVAQGKAKAGPLIPLAEELREFEMPKPIFSTGEKIEWTAGRFGDAHTQAEMDTNISGALSGAGAPREMANARGRLVPFAGIFLPA